MWQLLKRRAREIIARRARRAEKRRRNGPRWRAIEPLEARQLLATVDGAVIFNEVMYHPTGGNDDLQWIELYNPSAISVDISGWKLDGGINFTFPSAASGRPATEGTILASRQYLVVASNPTALAAATGLSGIKGPYSGFLSHGGEKIKLMNNFGRLMDELDYGDSGKWPVGADGSGASLAKLLTESDSSNPANWTHSVEIGGTPGARNFVDPNTPPTVTQLITSNASWKYNAGGTDLGTAWRQSGYSDAAWSSGAANLYYGSAGGSAGTATVSAKITADNYFAVYAGNADGTNLRYLGRDSVGDWSSPESFNVSLSAGEYVYVVGWDAGGAQSLIGEITLPDNTRLGTNTTDWKYAVGPTNGIPGGSEDGQGNILTTPPPTVSAVQTVITGANASSLWRAPQVQAARSTSPWGGSVGGAFTDAARFIWADTFSLGGDNSICDTNNTYILFRTANPVLPGLGTTQLPAGANTYYFRKTFSYSGNLAQTTLTLDTIVDDGAVYYLNGYEVYRQNMPLGDVAYATPASGEVANPPGTTYQISIPTDHLLSGTNVLQVEVHNSTVPDEDMLFGAALTATVSPATASSTRLALNEVAAGQPDGFFVELANYGTSSLPLGGYVIASSAGGEYVLPSQDLAAGNRLSLTQAQLGFGAAAGDRLFLYTPDRHGLIDAVKVDTVLRGRSPEGTGAWLYPSAATPGSPNTFQLRSDVVINEIMYNHRPAWVNVAIPPVDVPEQWIELYNRGAEAVNLSGWRLSDAVDYAFPEGTSIAVGGYLVISNNHVALQAEYPTITTIVGDFTRQLSRSSDHIVLKDANGNPVDEVTYYDGGNWPEYADAGGSSLELRNPNADNSKPEAWAASDESGRAAWKTYTYTVVAQSSVVGPDSQWREFDLGLLSSGVVLLDNISVKDMSAGGTELISNGNFEGGTGPRPTNAPSDSTLPPANWRMLGNHSRSSVIVDPSNAANRVLKLVATGPTEHMNNHLETNVASITNGHTYQVSFKARWVDGCNQVNTRLYFDRAVATTLIDQPALSGTPGSQNSTYAASVGPTYHDLKHAPVVPAAMAPVTVSVVAEDPDGVASLKLYYSVQGGAWQNVTMTTQAGGLYQGIIPGQAASSVVQFYVDGADALGAHSYYPAGGANSRAMYKVNDGLAATNGLHNLRIIMRPADANWLGDGSNVMSNDPVPCTVIYDESQVYYDVGVRTKASERGRLQPLRVGFFVYFNADQLFRGLHGTVGFDRSDGVNFGQREMLIKQAMGHYGCVNAEYSDLVQLIGATNMAVPGPAEMQPTHFSNNLLDSQFDNGADGTEFNYDFIYYPTSTNAQGYKVAEPDGVVGTNLATLVSIGNLLTNSSFESWTGSVPNNWTVVTGGSNITRVATASDGSYALQIRGDAGGTLSAITQTLSLSVPARVYTLVFRVRNDGTVPAVGSLTFSLVDGNGAVIQDGQGNSNVYSVALTSTTSSYTTYTALFMTPSALPATVKLKIGLGTALTSGRAVYVDGVSLSDLGDAKEQYRFSLITKNNRVDDDYSQIVEFAKFWATSGTAFTEHVSEYIDVDSWLRGFAFGVLNGMGDNFTQGDQHNAMFYVRPSDGRVVFFAKDLDAFYSYNKPVDASADLQKLLAVPAYKHTYYGYLYDIIQTTWNTTYMGTWASNYGSLLPAQDFPGFLSFIGQRSSYVSGLITSAIPHPSQGDFALTTVGGTVSTPTITVSGVGWVNVGEIHLNGSNDALPIKWTGNTTWQVTVPLAGGPNVLNFQAYNFQGSLLSTKSITVTSTASPSPLQQYLRITELNYNPTPATADEIAHQFTDQDFEFIELTNTSATQSLNLQGVNFTAGITYTFATALNLAAGSRILLVKNQAAFEYRYGEALRPQIAGVFLSGSLNNGGEEITLVDGVGLPLADFTYGVSGLWPGRANGGGSTLEPISTSGDYNDPSNWQSSIQYNGTPGAASATADVVVNEVLTHTDQPLVDAIELYNTTGNPIDISGWWLSDSSTDYLKFHIPDNTTIAAGGYLVFYEGHWEDNTLAFATNAGEQYIEFGGGTKGFGLNSAHGDDVYLVQTDSSGNITRFSDHAGFGAAANGQSWGRWQDDQGHSHFYPLVHRTLDAPNNDNATDGNGPRTGSLVISEVMYAPAPLVASEQTAGFADQEDMEFVEIYNPTAAAVDLANWHLDKGVTYDFVGTSLAAGQTLVVVPFSPSNAPMLAAFRTRYANTTATVVGPFSGHLSNAGDRVQLQSPDTPPIEEPAWYPPLLEDEVVYSPSWGAGTADGKSLHRVATDAWGDYKASWAAGTASLGAARLVAGAYVFYNNSAFDGRSASANTSDDGAIATDKKPLLAGRTATFDNYTSYSRGINGILLDIAGLAANTTLTTSDFAFLVWDGASWVAAPAPTTIATARTAPSPLVGMGRVTLIWADGAIANQWLQVTVKATTATGLAGPHVFYFGNAVGETGNHRTSPGADAAVDQTDEAGARAHMTSSTPAPITSVYDFNHDRRINATDEILARANYRIGTNALPLLDLTAPGQAAAGAMAAAAAGQVSNLSSFPVSAAAAIAEQVSSLPASAAAAAESAVPVEATASTQDAALITESPSPAISPAPALSTTPLARTDAVKKDSGASADYAVPSTPQPAPPAPRRIQSPTLPLARAAHDAVLSALRAGDRGLPDLRCELAWLQEIQQRSLRHNDAKGRGSASLLATQDLRTMPR